MLLFALALRRKPPALESAASAGRIERSARPLGLAPNTMMALLIVAGIGCCVALSMPQVHIVAYCGDLGYGAARGAEMLSIMLAFGIVSRLVSGWICDRIGGLRTLLLGSFLQGVALLLFLPFDGLASLYVVSAMFGLFQGGIVPSYAIIVREYFAPREAGVRTGIVLMATLFGMAFGGWISGVIFDFTGSYRAAFVNGIAFNLLNLTIATWLLRRLARQSRAQHAVHMGSAAEDPLLLLLRHAAAHADHHVGPVLLVPAELTQARVHFVSRLLAHRAGVEEDDVGFRLPGRRTHPHRAQGAGHLLRVVRVHLAAPGLDAVGPQILEPEAVLPGHLALHDRDFDAGLVSGRGCAPGDEDRLRHGPARNPCPGVSPGPRARVPG